MAAFPNQYIATAVGGNGGQLDKTAAGDNDPSTYLAKTVDDMAQALYPTRFIVQRNAVSATTPMKDDSDDTTWTLLAERTDNGYLTAGQALWNCWNDTTYRMNGGDNACNHDDPLCLPPCDPGSSCYSDPEAILDRSTDHLLTYAPSYYEIYQPDAANLTDSVTRIHDLLSPTPTPSPRPGPRLPW
jgi:hypothetical protein